MSRQLMNASRFAAVLVCCLLTSSCRQSYVIEYVFPVDFKGSFALIAESRDGAKIKRRDNVLVMDVPTSGVLRITDPLPTHNWHRSRAYYSDGRALQIAGPGTPVPPESIALRRVATFENKEEWYVVGTYEEAASLQESLLRDRTLRGSTGQVMK